MNTADLNSSMIEGYMDMLRNLTLSSKLDLISRLSASVKSDIEKKPSTFQRAFGGFTGDETAEQIIEEIRSSRRFTRQVEGL